MDKRVDSEVLYALQEVQIEIKEEFGEDFSIEELYDVTHSQFSASVYAFKKGVEVRLPFFGSFIRKHIAEKVNLIKKLKEYKTQVSHEEYMRKKKAIDAYNIAVSAKRKKARNKKGLSYEEFSALPVLNNMVDKYRDTDESI